jgi:hypothetical protein
MGSPPSAGHTTPWPSLGEVVSFGQKPDRLKVPCRGHIRARPVLLLQSRNAQMIRHMRHGSSPRLMALQPIRVPDPGESPAHSISRSSYHTAEGPKDKSCGLTQPHAALRQHRGYRREDVSTEQGGTTTAKVAQRRLEPRGRATGRRGAGSPFAGNPLTRAPVQLGAKEKPASREARRAGEYSGKLQARSRRSSARQQSHRLARPSFS